MILADNINILKNAYPISWNNIKLAEASLNKNLVKLEILNKGQKTLYVDNNGKKTYIHSKYNPLREAESIIEEYEDIKDNSTVIFYGTGLGYHIDLFLEKYPNVDYYIYESIPELLYHYLGSKEIKNLPNKNLNNLILGNSQEIIISFLNNIVDRTKEDLTIIILPIHKQIFNKEYDEFVSLFKTLIKDKRSNIHTNYAFQERWITNSMKNLKEVLNTPNVLIEKKGVFKNKPAILVAAGPSLNEEIENLRYIKEKGLAYIFSVGSAINTLVYHNIYPDAACTYDPTEENQKVFTKIKELEIEEIPIIFGSSVGYEVLLNYPGEKYHMITSQDTVSSYYLKNSDNSDINIVFDAPTIAVVTMQLLYNLGFNPIILVGQNLGYRGREQYSEGISYSKLATDKEIENSIKIKDVYGNELFTNEGYNSMRKQMEHYIKNMPNVRVLNTTKGGAYIEGAEYIELKDIINGELQANTVDVNWLDGYKTKYDIKYLKIQSSKMDRAYRKVTNLNTNYYDILNKIEKSLLNRKFTEVENLYAKLDKALKEIEENDFYKVFILPTNRLQYKLLIDSIDNLNREKDPLKKGKKIIHSFRGFLDICVNNIQEIEPIYKELKEDIAKKYNE